MALTNKTEIPKDVIKERSIKILEEEEKLTVSSDQSKTLKNASPRINTIYTYYQNIIVRGKAEVNSYKNDKNFKNGEGNLYEKAVETASKLLICNRKIQMLEEADNFSTQLSTKGKEEYMNLKHKLIDLEVKKMREFWVKEALSPKEEKEIDSEIKYLQKKIKLIIDTSTS